MTVTVPLKTQMLVIIMYTLYSIFSGITAFNHAVICSNSSGAAECPNPAYTSNRRPGPAICGGKGVRLVYCQTAVQYSTVQPISDFTSWVVISLKPNLLLISVTESWPFLIATTGSASPCAIKIGIVRACADIICSALNNRFRPFLFETYSFHFIG